MAKATPVPGKTLLSPGDHTLILIDHQSQMAFATKSIDPVLLRNNAALVAKSAAGFGVSTILTTVAEKSFSGPIFNEISEAFPGVAAIDRTSMNTWEDPRIAERVNANVRSIGLALTDGTVPHAGEPGFVLPEDEIEFGVGIHGEPGRERIKLEPADRLVDRMMDAILADLSYEGSPVLLFVNGMGGTPLSELYILYRRAAEILDERGIRIDRSLVGNYVTSLEMQGASITLLKLDDEFTQLWDAPVHTAALRWGL